MSAHRTPEKGERYFAAGGRGETLGGITAAAGQGRASRGGARRPHHPAGHRHPGEIPFTPRRAGRPAVDGADAVGHPGRDRRDRRGGKRRPPRRADSRPLRRRCSRNCWIKRPIWPAVSRRRTESLAETPSAHKRDRFTASKRYEYKGVDGHGKREQLFTKEKPKVFATEDPELYIVDYRDDATAFNGEKRRAPSSARASSTTA